MHRIVALLTTFGVAATTAGCSPDESAHATGRPMAATDTTAAVGDTANHVPVIESVTLHPAAPRAGERVTAEVTATDPDGDAIQLTYQWSIGHQKIDGGSVLPVPNVPKGTRISVRVTARDGQAVGSPVTANAAVGNQPPLLLGIGIEPRGNVTVEHDLQAVPRATDPDGDMLDYRYTWRVNGREVEDSGAILDRNEFRRADEITLSVVASDGAEDSLPIKSQSISVGNAPPRIVSAPGALTGEGDFRYPVVVTDPDGDRRFRFRLLEAPDGMRVDFVTGLVTWQPAPNSAGRHAVLVEVDDLAGGTTTQSFQLDVAFETSGPPAAAAGRR